LLNLPSLDNSEAQSYTNELSGQTSTLRALFTKLSLRIKSLEQGNVNLIALIAAGQSSLRKEEITNTRMIQVQALKEKFKESISKYSIVEKNQRGKEKNRLERQLKIFNPDITDEELNRIVRDSNRGSNSMFAQSVGRFLLFFRIFNLDPHRLRLVCILPQLISSSQRSVNARGAFKEAESRKQNLERIEATLIELAELFQDMALIGISLSHHLSQNPSRVNLIIILFRSPSSRYSNHRSGNSNGHSQSRYGGWVEEREKSRS
jgi:syntaxin 1B/2/3